MGSNPIATWIIGGLVIGLLVWITIRAIKNRKKSSCGCGCDGCPQAKECHSFREPETKEKK